MLVIFNPEPDPWPLKMCRAEKVAGQLEFSDEQLKQKIVVSVAQGFCDKNVGNRFQ